MWITKMLVFSYPTVIIGLNFGSMHFSVNYFKERNVQFLCLVTCEASSWDVKFTRAASQHSIKVSVMHDLRNMKRCCHQHYNTVGVLMDAECADAEQILYTASENMWLDATHIWLIIDKVENLEAYNNETMNVDENSNKNLTFGMLSNLNLSIDADVIVAYGNGNEFELYDVFNFGKIQGGNLSVSEVGTWKADSGNDIAKLNDYKFYKRWDFGQSPLRMMSVATSPPKNLDPAVLTDIRPVPYISTITRSSTMALAVVAEIHNIKFVHTITDRWVGSYNKNSSKAVSAALYLREQDLTSVLRIQLPLMDQVTFLCPPLTSLETRYYYRIPTTGPGKYENQFLRPLSYGTWCCMLAITAACAVILVFAARLESRPSSVQYAVFSVTASFCQQFFEDETQILRVSAARKLTVFITGLLCVLVFNYYTSSVVSWLLSGPPPSINSLQELLESPLELIYKDSGYTRSWLNTPGYYYNRRNAKDEDALRKKVLSKKQSTSVMRSLEEGIAMVKAGGYAYHVETYGADTLISQTFDKVELCELGSLSSMDKTYLYPGVQRDSPYKEFLTWSLIRISERGIVSCIQKRTTPQSVSCEGSSPRALALGGAAPAFILLAMGIFSATVIMFIERFIHKTKQNVKLNKNKLYKT